LTVAAGATSSDAAIAQRDTADRINASLAGVE
jgi:hypothetical protein